MWVIFYPFKARNYFLDDLCLQRIWIDVSEQCYKIKAKRKYCKASSYSDFYNICDYKTPLFQQHRAITCTTVFLIVNFYAEINNILHLVLKKKGHFKTQGKSIKNTSTGLNVK
jgi:hypothetical protein